MDTLTIRRPDDWHLHVRDDDTMAAVLPFTVQRFARAIVMPNLQPPIVDTAMALAYRERILAALPAGSDFEPLMVLYLTDRTSPEEIERAAQVDCIRAVKLYPAGATTHSDAGVTRLEATHPALEAMAACGMPLLVHGEVTEPEVDVFDREAVFIDRVLAPLSNRFPALRIVLEHITTAAAVEFVRTAHEGIAATVTPQHILMNRNALFSGGFRPHHYCLPVLKAESHREAVAEAATGGSPRFFLGTDSAPHARSAKESACGCAGIFSAHAGIELYAEAFAQAGRLENLEAFASLNGPAYYGLAPNEDRIRLVREAWKVPDVYPLTGGEFLVPLRAGGEIEWRLAGAEEPDAGC